MLACGAWFYPATSTATGVRRATKATICFAAGAIIGWPFTAVLALPFVFEQLFLTGGEVCSGAVRQVIMSRRMQTMARAVAVGASLAVSLLDTR